MRARVESEFDHSTRREQHIAASSMSTAKQFVQSTIAAHKVVVWSKTYCPYCTKAKSALASVGASFHLVELDHRNDGDELQNVLLEMTGARSVPRVFINGKCIGVSGGEPSGAARRARPGGAARGSCLAARATAAARATRARLTGGAPAALAPPFAGRRRHRGAGPERAAGQDAGVVFSPRGGCALRRRRGRGWPAASF